MTPDGVFLLVCAIASVGVVGFWVRGQLADIAQMERDMERDMERLEAFVGELEQHVGALPACRGTPPVCWRCWRTRCSRWQDPCPPCGEARDGSG